MRRQSCREAKHSAAAGAVVLATCRPWTVDSRQFVASGVTRGCCSSVAAVCFAHELVCLSIWAVSVDSLRAQRDRTARLGHKSDAWSIFNCFVISRPLKKRITVFSGNRLSFDAVKESTSLIYFCILCSLCGFSLFL